MLALPYFVSTKRCAAMDAMPQVARSAHPVHRRKGKEIQSHEPKYAPQNEPHSTPAAWQAHAVYSAGRDLAKGAQDVPQEPVFGALTAAAAWRDVYAAALYVQPGQKGKHYCFCSALGILHGG